MERNFVYKAMERNMDYTVRINHWREKLIKYATMEIFSECWLNQIGYRWCYLWKCWLYLL